MHFSYRDVLLHNGKLFPSEKDLAFNPLAIYKTMKHLTVDLHNAREIMAKNNYRDEIQGICAPIILESHIVQYVSNNVLKIISDGKMHEAEERSVILPKLSSLYNQIRQVVYLERVYNLTIAEMKDVGNSSMTGEVLTGK